MVPLSAGQSETVGGGLMPVDEGGNVEFPVGKVVRDLEGDEREVVAFPDADGTPVEGLTTVVVDTGEVLVGTIGDEDDREPLLVPTGVELLATGMLDDTPGELILIGLEDENVDGVEVILLVGAGVLLEAPHSPRPPPLILGMPIVPVSEELAAGVGVGTETPLEGDEVGGTMVVPLLEGTGADDEAGGTVEILVVGGTGGAIVVPLPEGAGADEDERELGLRFPVENVGEGIMLVIEVVLLALGPIVVGFTV